MILEEVWLRNVNWHTLLAPWAELVTAAEWQTNQHGGLGAEVAECCGLTEAPLALYGARGGSSGWPPTLSRRGALPVSCGVGKSGWVAVWHWKSQGAGGTGHRGPLCILKAQGVVSSDCSQAALSLSPSKPWGLKAEEVETLLCCWWEC